MIGIFKLILDFIITYFPVLLTLIMPITVYRMVLPFIFRPDILGSIPWFEPSQNVMTFFYLFFLTLFIYLLSMTSCILKTLSSCQKYSFLTSSKYATFVITWLWMGILCINTLLLPYGKAFLLSTLRLPYNLYFVDGIMLTPFVFIGTLLAVNNVEANVCEN